MSASTDCVLVVHGTWNRPEPGKPPKWYQLSPSDEHNFCSRLTAHLKMHGIGDAVWRGHQPGHEFCWSGENSHEDRLKAAHALCKLFLRLTDQTPRPCVHVVAHSHGGNVLLKAIELYYKQLWERALPEAQQIEGFARWLKDRSNRRRDVPPDLQKFMRERLERDSVLGRIVFLGTPFLEKHWEAARGKVMWFLSNSIAVIKALPTIGFGMYLGGMMWAYIIAAMIKAAGWVLGRPWLEDTWPAFNPLQWSTTWQVIFGVFLVMSFLLLFFERWRWDTNYYFDARALSRLFGPKVASVPALVVTARYLDEALLFLSAEPLAHLFIVSRVLNRLRGLLHWKSPDAAERHSSHLVGEDPDALRSGTVLVDLVAKLVGGVLKLVAAPLGWCIRKAFLERVTTRLVIDALESAAFGLPMEEVRHASVEVKEQPDQPGFFTETLWRTQDLALLAAPPPPRIAGDAADRYAHLTDEQALRRRRERAEKVEEDEAENREAKRKATENTWMRLAALAPSICRAKNPMASQQEIDAYKEHLARLWFTLEERASELGGSVELVHSLYYSNERVVSAVAAFLATGEVPVQGVAVPSSLEVASASGNVAAV